MQYFLFVLLFVLLGNLSRTQPVTAEPMHSLCATTLCGQAAFPNQTGCYDHSCIAPEITICTQVPGSDHRIFARCVVSLVRAASIQSLTTEHTRIGHPVRPYCRPADYYVYSLGRMLI